MNSHEAVRHCAGVHAPDGAGDGEISLRVRRACEGESASLSWVVGHFTPFLHHQAKRRLQACLRRLLDPDDLVDEVWTIVIPRMARLSARNGHWTAVLVKYLGTTLENRVKCHLSRYLRTEAPHCVGPSRPRLGDVSLLDRLPSQAASVLATAARDEACEMLRGALGDLEPQERELLTLRGIDQYRNQEVARQLGIDPSTATKRYQRVLGKLRAHLPGSICEELPVLERPVGSTARKKRRKSSISGHCSDGCMRSEASCMR